MNNYNAQISGKNFNELFINAIYQIYKNGKWTNPRKFNCKEIVAPQLILKNPLDCLCTISKRKLNYAYLIIEKFMYLSKISLPDILIIYNSNMKNYLNEKTKDFDGAYGLRIAENDQLDYCYNTLKRDPESRQAVITIHNSSDCRETLDNACTQSLQFLLRDNKLNLIVNMRSSDLLWGICLDIPAFCFFQEVMAHWLNVNIGIYIHQPVSLHYYSEFENKLLDILDINEQPEYEIVNNNIVNEEKNPNWNISYDETKNALQLFWQEEKNIRKNLQFINTKYDIINQYLQRLLIYWQKKYETKN